MSQFDVTSMKKQRSHTAQHEGRLKKQDQPTGRLGLEIARSGVQPQGTEGAVQTTAPEQAAASEQEARGEPQVSPSTASGGAAQRSPTSGKAGSSGLRLRLTQTDLPVAQAGRARSKMSVDVLREQGPAWSKIIRGGTRRANSGNEASADEATGTASTDTEQPTAGGGTKTPRSADTRKVVSRSSGGMLGGGKEKQGSQEEESRAGSPEHGSGSGSESAHGSLPGMVASSSEGSAPGSSQVSPQSSTQEDQVTQAVSPDFAPVLVGLQSMLDRAVDRLDARMTARMDKMQQALEGKEQSLAEVHKCVDQLAADVAAVQQQQSRRGEAWNQAWDAAVSHMEKQLDTVQVCTRVAYQTKQKLQMIDMKGFERRVQQAQQKAEQAEGHIQTLNGKVQELTAAVGKFETLNGTVNGLATAVGQLKSVHTGRKGIKAQEGAATYAHKAGMPSAEEWQAFQKEQTASHEARAAEISALQADMTAACRQVEDLQSKIVANDDASAADISALQADMTAACRQVEDLQAKIVANDTDAISTEVRTLQDRMQHLDAGLSAEAANIRGLQHAVVRVENECNAKVQEVHRRQQMWQQQNASSMSYAPMPHAVHGQNAMTLSREEFQRTVHQLEERARGQQLDNTVAKEERAALRQQITVQGQKLAETQRGQTALTEDLQAQITVQGQRLAETQRGQAALKEELQALKEELQAARTQLATQLAEAQNAARQQFAANENSQVALTEDVQALQEQLEVHAKRLEKRPTAWKVKEWQEESINKIFSDVKTFVVGEMAGIRGKLAAQIGAEVEFHNEGLDEDVDRKIAEAVAEMHRCLERELEPIMTDIFRLQYGRPFPEAVGTAAQFASQGSFYGPERNELTEMTSSRSVRKLEWAETPNAGTASRLEVPYKVGGAQKVARREHVRVQTPSDSEESYGHVRKSEARSQRISVERGPGIGRGRGYGRRGGHGSESWASARPSFGRGREQFDVVSKRSQRVPLMKRVPHGSRRDSFQEHLQHSRGDSEESFQEHFQQPQGDNGRQRHDGAAFLSSPDRQPAASEDEECATEGSATAERDGEILPLNEDVLMETARAYSSGTGGARGSANRLESGRSSRRATMYQAGEAGHWSELAANSSEASVYASRMRAATRSLNEERPQHSFLSAAARASETPTERRQSFKSTVARAPDTILTGVSEPPSSGVGRGRDVSTQEAASRLPRQSMFACRPSSRHPDTQTMVTAAKCLSKYLDGIRPGYWAQVAEAVNPAYVPPQGDLKDAHVKDPPDSIRFCGHQTMKMVAADGDKSQWGVLQFLIHFEQHCETHNILRPHHLQKVLNVAMSRDVSISHQWHEALAEAQREANDTGRTLSYRWLRSIVINEFAPRDWAKQILVQWRAAQVQGPRPANKWLTELGMWTSIVSYMAAEDGRAWSPQFQAIIIRQGVSSVLEGELYRLSTDTFDFQDPNVVREAILKFAARAPRGGAEPKDVSGKSAADKRTETGSVVSSAA